MSTIRQETEQALARLQALARAGDVAALSREVGALHPSDLADVVEALDEEQRVLLLEALPAELASETLAEMEEGDERGDLLAALEPARGAELLHELADDDATDLVGELEPHERQRILEELDVEEAGDIRGLLQYDEETAGGLMTTDLVSVESSLTAAEALQEVRIQGREVEDFYTVFVVDERHRLLGTVRLDDLVTAEPDEAVSELVEPPAARVLPDVDQEHVGMLIGRYNLAAIPVVDEFDVLLGRITFDDVIDVIEAEHTEDILRLAGLGDHQEALRQTWGESVRSRLPWLFLNLATAFLAGLIPYLFGATIEQAVILAALMPVIAGMGGNTATQALAVTTRRIAMSDHPEEYFGIIRKEVLTGLVNGLAIGLTAAVVGTLVPGGGPALGVVVLIAMWGNMVVAGLAGSAIPVLLHKLGIDPAVASSVFVTTFTDLCGFFFLLGLATAVLF